MSEKFDYTDKSRIRVIDGGKEYVSVFVGEPDQSGNRIVAWSFDGAHLCVDRFSVFGIAGPRHLGLAAPPMAVILHNGDIVRDGDITIVDTMLWRWSAATRSPAIWLDRTGVLTPLDRTPVSGERLATASELAASTIPLTDINEPLRSEVAKLRTPDYSKLTTPKGREVMLWNVKSSPASSGCWFTTADGEGLGFIDGYAKRAATARQYILDEMAPNRWPFPPETGACIDAFLDAMQPQVITLPSGETCPVGEIAVNQLYFLTLIDRIQNGKAAYQFWYRQDKKWASPIGNVFHYDLDGFHSGYGDSGGLLRLAQPEDITDDVDLSVLPADHRLRVAVEKRRIEKISRPVEGVELKTIPNYARLSGNGAFVYIDSRVARFISCDGDIQDYGDTHDERLVPITVARAHPAFSAENLARLRDEVRAERRRAVMFRLDTGDQLHEGELAVTQLGTLIRRKGDAREFFDAESRTWKPSENDGVLLRRLAVLDDLPDGIRMSDVPRRIRPDLPLADAVLCRAGRAG